MNYPFGYPEGTRRRPIDPRNFVDFSDIVAYWPLDEEYGFNKIDHVNGYDLKEVNNVQNGSGVAGRRCLQVSGLSGWLMTNNPSHNTPLRVRDNTLLMWLHINENSNSRIVGHKTTAYSAVLADAWCYSLYRWANSAAAGPGSLFQQNISSTANQSGAFYKFGIQPDNWHFIAATQYLIGAGLGSQFAIYIDGILAGADTWPFDITDQGVNTTFTVGAESDGTKQGNFQLQDLSLLNRALTSSEIATISELVGASR